MAKALMYTELNAATALTENSVIPLGNIVRRFGCAINQNGNSILLKEQGYYKITVLTEFEPTAATAFIMSLQENGNIIQGIEVTPTAAGAETETVLTAIVRVFGCQQKLLNVHIGNAGTVNRMYVVAEKM